MINYFNEINHMADTIINENHAETTFSDLEKAIMKKEEEKIEEDYTNKLLIYGVKDNPPIQVTIVCAFQQGLLSLSSQLIVSLLVAEAVCASDNNAFKAKLLSSTLFMSGLTTIAMNLFGLRLPLFQGAAAFYIIPLLLVANIEEGTFCSSLAKDTDTESTIENLTALTGNSTEVSMERILGNVRALQGSLVVAGIVHTLVGATGLLGVFIRYVGPLTIVPTMILMFVFLVNPVLKFVEVNWAIATSTVVVAMILSLYLSKYQMPIPIWTPSQGFRIIRYPLHQIFAILISMLINWALCGILTNAGVFTDDPKDNGFQARTDSRSSVIQESPWFTFPYPGQYGSFGFSGPAFISCLIATLLSVLDSVGDYYACARVCRVPPPPSHAMNRGIFIEGLCSILSGAIGSGHATSTYGGNIGAIGVTKVASRRVFLCTGILYTLFGIFGKFSAIFITIPYPVLGGAIVVMYGIFFGVVCSNLEVINMSSPRNIAILGLSVFIGLMVPTWVAKVKTPFETGNDSVDRILAMLIGNPTLVGTTLAFFLDNTVSGTREERGLAAWHAGESEDMTTLDSSLYQGGFDVYNPLLPERFLQMSIIKYIPFLPYRKKEEIKK